MSPLKRIAIFMLVLAVSAGLLGVSASPAAAAEDLAATCTKWHTVQRGEYLSQIARLYGVSWRTLADINNLANPSRIYAGNRLCISMSGTPSNDDGGPILPGTGGSVRVYALSVDEDSWVELQGTGLAKNSRYTVSMFRQNLPAHGSYRAGTVVTDSKGTFNETFSLPSAMRDVAKVGVTISNAAGDRASNWFINADLEGNTGGLGAAALTASIVSVRHDQWVRIRTANLPANVAFHVTMGKSGSKGVNGFDVGTLVDEDGGAVRATFDIPDELQGRSRLDLRLENKALGMVYYLTFDN
jgi:LysM repeat protein